MPRPGRNMTMRELEELFQDILAKMYAEFHNDEMEKYDFSQGLDEYLVEDLGNDLGILAEMNKVRHKIEPFDIFAEPKVNEEGSVEQLLDEFIDALIDKNLQLSDKTKPVNADEKTELELLERILRAPNATTQVHQLLQNRILENFAAEDGLSLDEKLENFALSEELLDHVSTTVSAKAEIDKAGKDVKATGLYKQIFNAYSKAQENDNAHYMQVLDNLFILSPYMNKLKAPVKADYEAQKNPQEKKAEEPQNVEAPQIVAERQEEVHIEAKENIPQNNAEPEIVRENEQPKNAELPKSSFAELFNQAKSANDIIPVTNEQRKNQAKAEYLDGYTTYIRNHQNSKINSNSTEELQKELNAAGNDEKLKHYLEKRINGMQKIDQLAENAKLGQPKPATLTSDGGIVLTGAKQKSMQNTEHGCWSVALATLLDYRGVEIDQETIRAFRPDVNYDLNNDHTIEDLANADDKNELENYAGLVHTVLPNTAMNAAMVSNPSKDVATNAFKAILDKGFKESNSPIAVLTGNGGHYKTIYGMGKDADGKDSVLVYDPIADAPQSITIDKFIDSCNAGTEDENGNIAAPLYRVSTVWLEDMTLDKERKLSGNLANADVRYDEKGDVKGREEYRVRLAGKDGVKCFAGAELGIDNIKIHSYIPTKFKNLELKKENEVKAEAKPALEKEEPAEKKHEPVRYANGNVIIEDEVDDEDELDPVKENPAEPQIEKAPAEQPKAEDPQEIVPAEPPKAENPQEIAPAEPPKAENPQEIAPAEQPKAENPQEIAPAEQPKAENPQEIAPAEQPKAENHQEPPKAENQPEIAPAEQPKEEENNNKEEIPIIKNIESNDGSILLGIEPNDDNIIADKSARSAIFEKDLPDPMKKNGRYVPENNNDHYIFENYEIANVKDIARNIYNGRTTNNTALTLLRNTDIAQTFTADAGKLNKDAFDVYIASLKSFGPTGGVTKSLKKMGMTEDKSKKLQKKLEKTGKISRADAIRKEIFDSVRDLQRDFERQLGDGYVEGKQLPVLNESGIDQLQKACEEYFQYADGYHNNAENRAVRSIALSAGMAKQFCNGPFMNEKEALKASLKTSIGRAANELKKISEHRVSSNSELFKNFYNALSGVNYLLGNGYLGKLKGMDAPAVPKELNISVIDNLREQAKKYSEARNFKKDDDDQGRKRLDIANDVKTLCAGAELLLSANKTMQKTAEYNPSKEELDNILKNQDIDAAIKKYEDLTKLLKQEEKAELKIEGYISNNAKLRNGLFILNKTKDAWDDELREVVPFLEKLGEKTKAFINRKDIPEKLEALKDPLSKADEKTWDYIKKNSNKDLKEPKKTHYQVIWDMHEAVSAYSNQLDYYRDRISDVKSASELKKSPYILQALQERKKIREMEKDAEDMHSKILKNNAGNIYVDETKKAQQKEGEVENDKALPEIEKKAALMRKNFEREKDANEMKRTIFRKQIEETEQKSEELHAKNEERKRQIVEAIPEKQRALQQRIEDNEKRLAELKKPRVEELEKLPKYGEKMQEILEKNQKLRTLLTLLAEAPEPDFIMEVGTDARIAPVANRGMDKLLSRVDRALNATEQYITGGYEEQPVSALEVKDKLEQIQKIYRRVDELDKQKSKEVKEISDLIKADEHALNQLKAKAENLTRKAPEKKLLKAAGLEEQTKNKQQNEMKDNKQNKLTRNSIFGGTSASGKKSEAMLMKRLDKNADAHAMHDAIFRKRTENTERKLEKLRAENTQEKDAKINILQQRIKENKGELERLGNLRRGEFRKLKENGNELFKNMKENMEYTLRSELLMRVANFSQQYDEVEWRRIFTYDKEIIKKAQEITDGYIAEKEELKNTAKRKEKKGLTEKIENAKNAKKALEQIRNICENIYEMDHQKKFHEKYNKIESEILNDERLLDSLKKSKEMLDLKNLKARLNVNQPNKTNDNKLTRNLTFGGTSASKKKQERGLK